MGKPAKKPLASEVKKAPAKVVPINQEQIDTTNHEPAKAEKITDPVLPIHMVDSKIRDDVQEFATSVARKIQLKSQLEAELDGDPKKGILGERQLLVEMLKDAKIKGVDLPAEEGKALRVSRYASVNTWVDEKKLLANGVAADTIKKSKSSKAYVTVRATVVTAGDNDE